MSRPNDLERTILCFGDSNTWGFDAATGERLPRDVRWACRLQQLLPSGYQVVEAGLNGRTTIFDDPVTPGRCGLDYLSVIMRQAAPLDLMILWLGTNDCKERFHATPKDILDGYRQLVDLALDPMYWNPSSGPRILIPSPVPVDMGYVLTWAAEEMGRDADIRSAELQGLLADYANAHSFLQWLDLRSILETHPNDHIHLTKESHSQVATRLAEVIPALVAD